jgi:hypothetical protein
MIHDVAVYYGIALVTFIISMISALLIYKYCDESFIKYIIILFMFAFVAMVINTTCYGHYTDAYEKGCADYKVDDTYYKEACAFIENDNSIFGDEQAIYWYVEGYEDTANKDPEYRKIMVLKHLQEGD